MNKSVYPVFLVILAGILITGYYQITIFIHLLLGLKCLLNYLQLSFQVFMILIAAFIYHILITKKYRKQIENQRQEKLNLLNLLSSGFIILDKNFQVLDFNLMLLELLNLTHDGQIIQKFEELHLNDCKFDQKHKCCFWTEIQNSIGNTEINYQSIGVTAFEDKLLDWKLNRIIWNGEQQILLQCYDIQAFYNKYDFTLQSNYRTGLLRSVSHELRTPISAITHLYQSMFDHIQNEHLNNCLKQLVSTTKGLSRVVDDIVDYISIQQGDIEINYTKVQLLQMIYDCIDIIALKLTIKGLKVEINIDPKLDHIETDSNRLKQILTNLLTNAEKHTIQGKIFINVHRVLQDSIIFMVKDTGIGMDQAQIEEVRLLLASKHDFQKQFIKGMGFGLKISQELLTRIGGSQITVVSFPGIGTCFSFILPIGNVQEKPQYIQSISSQQLQWDSIDVLIVDDDSFIRILIKGLLTSKGYSCQTAEHGSDAINIIKENNQKAIFFQVVLMDCDMPVMDGWQATQTLMEMYENNEIAYKPKVLAHTAYSSPYDIERCKQAGMIRHICKNIPKDELFEILAEFIEQQKMNDIFLCGFCKVLYNENQNKPVSLPCGHVYCMSCVTQQSFFVCPIDQSKHRSQNLPVCYAIMLNLPQQKLRILCCKDHQSKKVKYFCHKEQDYLCSQCLIRHTGKGCQLSQLVVELKQVNESLDNLTKYISYKQFEANEQRKQLELNENQIRSFYENQIVKLNLAYEEIMKQIQQKQKEQIVQLQSHMEQSLQKFESLKDDIFQTSNKNNQYKQKCQQISNDLNSMSYKDFIKFVEQAQQSIQTQDAQKTPSLEFWTFKDTLKVAAFGSIHKLSTQENTAVLQPSNSAVQGYNTHRNGQVAIEKNPHRVHKENKQVHRADFQKQCTAKKRRRDQAKKLNTSF